MRTRTLFLAAVLVAVVLAWSPDACAGPPLATAYVEEFKEYWHGAFRKQNGIVLSVVGLGVVSVLIITRSKAKK